jgi:hypothetical protein
MSVLSRIFRSVNFKDPNEVIKSGRGEYGRGSALIDRSIGELDDLDHRTSADLDMGGLPPYLADVFTRERGAITDEAQRSRRAFAEDLLQLSRRSGGRFDPTSAADYQIEREADIDENAFTARNRLAADEAGVRMDNTNRLLDRLFAIRDRKLGAGEATRALASERELAAIMAKLERRKAIAATAASVFGTGYGR